MKGLSLKIDRTIIILMVLFMLIPGLTLSIAAAGQDESEAEKPVDIIAQIPDIDWHRGPYVAKMEDIAEVRVPMKFVFLDGNNTRKLMKLMGNLETNQEVGLLAPDSLEWFIVFEFENIGYVSDSEKDTLDAQKMLEAMQKGNQEGNEERRRRGLEPLYLVGWAVPPNYNQTSNNLEWATRIQDAKGVESINHNVRLLGRSGVMSAVLVADPQQYDVVVNDLQARLTDFSFQSGQKYAEYREGDKLAKIGLSALVVGGAAALAAKSGLLKHLWKFLVIIGAAILSFFKKLFGKKN